jgi:hypothetical protein
MPFPVCRVVRELTGSGTVCMVAAKSPTAQDKRHTAQTKLGITQQS